MLAITGALSCSEGQSGDDLERRSAELGKRSPQALPPPAPVARPGAAPWPMLRANRAHTGRSPFDGPPTDALRWSLDLGGAVRASPVVGPEGTVYVSTRRTLFAVEPSGGLLWSSPLGVTFASTPAVAPDGTVYTAWAGGVRALDGMGREIWRFVKGGPVASSFTLNADGTLLYGSLDHRMYALAPDGTLRWRARTGGAVHSTPVTGFEGTVYAGSGDGHGYAFEGLSGRELWKVRLGVRVDACPAVATDGTIYFGARDDGGTRLVAVSPDGDILWQVVTHTAPQRSRLRRALPAKLFARSPGAGDLDSSPALGADGTIYIGSEARRLLAVAPDGNLRWSFPTEGPVDSSPAVGGGGLVYFGDDAGVLYAVRDLGAAPELVWSHRAGGDINASPAIAPGGLLYVGADDAALRSFGGIPSEEQVAEACEGLSAFLCPCACEECLGELKVAITEPGIVPVAQCVIETARELDFECHGVGCYQPNTCQNVIDEAGGPASPPVQALFLFDACAQQACGDCP